MRDDVDRFYKIRDYSQQQELHKKCENLLCEWCGYSITIVHHIDCNPLNNLPKNIMFLCKVCHKKFHRYFPNWRYLHKSEIKNIILLAQQQLQKYDNTTTITKPTDSNERRERAKETWITEEFIKEDFRRHPLPV